MFPNLQVTTIQEGVCVTPKGKVASWDTARSESRIGYFLSCYKCLFLLCYDLGIFPKSATE